MDIIISAFTESIKLIVFLDPYLIEVASLSLVLSLASSAAAFAIGVPLGFIISEKRFFARGFVIALVNTGMGLPPVVVGLVVALLLGRAGVFGALEMLYSRGAIIISQFIIAFPMACGLSIAACGEVPENLKLQLRSFGATPLQTLYYLSRELSGTLPAIFLATFGSVISEVGAVMMVGGNILGETRVLTTAIVTDTRTGRYAAALAFAFVLLALTFAVNYLVSSIASKRGRER